MTDKEDGRLGYKERIKLLFGGSTQERSDDTQERTLHKAGIDILSDRKLQNRVELLMQFEDAITARIQTDDLEEYVSELMERTDLINHAIMEIAAPYGRAGSIPQFSRMFHGWGRLYASSKSWLLRTEDTITKKKHSNDNDGEGEQKEEYSILEHGAIDKRMHVRFLHDVLQKHIWKDGFLILNKCFLDRDVSIAAATVIQTMMPPRGSVPTGFEDGLEPTKKG